MVKSLWVLNPFLQLKQNILRGKGMKKKIRDFGKGSGNKYFTNALVDRTFQREPNRKRQKNLIQSNEKK